MYQEFDVSIVMVSLGISFVGCYLTISICEQLRLVSILNASEIFSKTGSWYLIMGITLGALGIWAPHLLSLIALDVFHQQQATRIRVHFGLCVITLIGALFSALLGVFISSFDVMFLKTRLEVMDLYNPRSQELSVAQMKVEMRKHLKYYVLTKDLLYLTVGSAVCASGTIICFYLTARSFNIPGNVEYNPGMVLLSIIVCFLAWFVVHVIVFRLLALAPYAEGLRMIASLVMVIATVCVGYIGMESRHYQYTGDYENRSIAHIKIAKHDLLYPLLICSMAVAGVIVIYLLAALRKITHKHLSKLKPQFDPKRIHISKIGELLKKMLAPSMLWKSNNTTNSSNTMISTPPNGAQYIIVNHVNVQEHHSSRQQVVDCGKDSEAVGSVSGKVIFFKHSNSSRSAQIDNLSIATVGNEAIV